MLEVVRRKLEEQQKLKGNSFTVGNLFDALYDLMNEKNVDRNERIIINNDMWSHFSCTTCGKLSDKEYHSTILEFEIEIKAGLVEIFTIKRK